MIFWRCTGLFVGFLLSSFTHTYLQDLPVVLLNVLEVHVERLDHLAGTEEETTRMRKTEGDVRHSAVMETHQELGDGVIVVSDEAVRRLEELENEVEVRQSCHRIDNFLHADLVLAHAVEVADSRSIHEDHLVFVREEPDDLSHFHKLIEFFQNIPRSTDKILIRPCDNISVLSSNFRLILAHLS